MGKKAYFTSRNLVRPEIVYEDMGQMNALKNMIYIKIIWFIVVVL